MVLVDIAVEALRIMISEFHFVLFGVFVGMFLGILPGMGGSVTIAILIPISLAYTPEQAFLLFGAALGSTTFAGSLTAILLNTPGSASNAATLLDGYPLTRQGKAKDAIGAAAVSSAFGALIGLGLFILLIPALRTFSLLFGSVEIFWLALAGIAVIPAAINLSMIKGLIGGCLGLLFALHGLDFMTGIFRYDYILAINPRGDIHVVPVIIGVFAIAEMLRLGIANERIDVEGQGLSGDLWAGIKSAGKNPILFLQSSIIGFVVGVIPGIGGSAASLMSYGFASNVTKQDAAFGEGNIEGVIASESANDSKDGGQLVPTFALGIPGSGSTAVLLGGFLAHGFLPGPQFIVDQLLIVMLTVWALIASNILTSIFGIVLSEQLVRLTQIDISYLFPAILSLTVFAAYISRNSVGDVYIAIIFGFIGLAFIYLGVSRISLIIAIVLGSIVEQNFSRVVILADDIGFLVNNPISGFLVVMLIVILVYPLLKYILARSRNSAV